MKLTLAPVTWRLAKPIQTARGPMVERTGWLEADRVLQLVFGGLFAWGVAR